MSVLSSVWGEKGTRVSVCLSVFVCTDLAVPLTLANYSNSNNNVENR